MSKSRWRWLLVGVGVLVTAATALGAPVRATYGGRTTADEPQYLLSAISVGEDFDLDISDELREERWREFHDAELPVQTEPTADGRAVSPHDPLLPLLLAGPVLVGGWLGAKLALAALAGVVAAAMVWVAVRRFAVSVAIATGVVLAFSLASPLSAYAVQVYPELPAALLVTVAVGALTGSFARRSQVVFALVVLALPWLAVKYGVVAVALAGLGLAHAWRRGDRRGAACLATGWAIAGVIFAGFHRLVYGGWTVYAAGDHFVADGEASVIGVHPDYLGRSQRLVGLLVDRGFGVATWAPVFLFGVIALGALARRRPAGWPILTLPLAAGWATATWVALTMHGYWWPGRQIVVVVPLLVLVTAWWLERHRRARPWFALAAVVGMVNWIWLVTEVAQLRLRLIIDFEATRNPFVRFTRPALPDYRQPGARTAVLTGAWVVVLLALGAVGWWTERDSGRGGSGGEDEDAVARKAAEADVVALDLDGEGAVG